MSFAKIIILFKKQQQGTNVFRLKFRFQTKSRLPAVAVEADEFD